MYTYIITIKVQATMVFFSFLAAYCKKAICYGKMFVRCVEAFMDKRFIFLVVLVVFFIFLFFILTVTDSLGSFRFVERGSFVFAGNNTVINYDFYIKTCEVTYNEFDAYTDSSRLFRAVDYDTSRGTRPVSNVGWMDAIGYCNWLSRKEKFPQAYDSSGKLIDENGNITSDLSKVFGYRLPTHEEWVYAAKGGSSSKNFSFAGSNDLLEIAWFWRNSGDMLYTNVYDPKIFYTLNMKSKPVGRKKPNELGLYDMFGNVKEWCMTIPAKGKEAPVKGGSYISLEQELSFESVVMTDKEYRSSELGFRIVRTVRSKD